MRFDRGGGPAPESGSFASKRFFRTSGVALTFERLRLAWVSGSLPDFCTPWLPDHIRSADVWLFVVDVLFDRRRKLVETVLGHDS